MQTKPCPGCGRLMIRIATGRSMPQYPPAYEMRWRCACGRIEAAGAEPDAADEDRFLRLWRMANRVDSEPRGG